MDAQAITVRRLGQRDYLPVWQEMQEFTRTRKHTSADEIWFTEHPPVFTQGLNGKPGHILDAGEIPVVAVDRGGQVTYHGPGQLLAYCMLDLNRRRWGVRQLVTALEQTVVEYLASLGIEAAADAQAPGVYVNKAKIASLGLRVKKGCSYHGLSLNVNMDLAPFARINPCGYHGLKVVQLADFIGSVSVEQVIPEFQRYLLRNLG